MHRSLFLTVMKQTDSCTRPVLYYRMPWLHLDGTWWNAWMKYRFCMKPISNPKIQFMKYFENIPSLKINILVWKRFPKEQASATMACYARNMQSAEKFPALVILIKHRGMNFTFFQRIRSRVCDFCKTLPAIPWLFFLWLLSGKG